MAHWNGGGHPSPTQRASALAVSADSVPLNAAARGFRPSRFEKLFV